MFWKSELVHPTIVKIIVLIPFLMLTRNIWKFDIYFTYRQINRRNTRYVSSRKTWSCAPRTTCIWSWIRASPATLQTPSGTPNVIATSSFLPVAPIMNMHIVMNIHVIGRGQITHFSARGTYMRLVLNMCNPTFLLQIFFHCSLSKLVL